MNFSNILEKLNKKYSSIDKKALAERMIKRSSDVGMAVVEILGSRGIAGFQFHVPESELVKFENEITDHYVDTGTAIQDHIVQKPITITLSGLVGDYFYSVHKISDMVALIIPTLTLVKEFVPQVAQSLGIRFSKETTPKLKQIQLPGGPQAPQEAAIAKNQFNAIDLYLLFQNLYKMKSAQTRAFLYFECLWKSRALFSIETTWKRYDNMVVQSIQARRDRNADITEFSITCKQITFANTLTTNIENEASDYVNNRQSTELANRREQEMSPIVDKGLESGTGIDDIEGEFILKAGVQENVYLEQL